jgi:hypothetical protein
MICHIYPVAVTGGAFHWKWRCDDGTRKSSQAFEFFYDCVEDARSHGARVNLERAHEEIASANLNVKIVAEDMARLEAAVKSPASRRAPS